jgi:hypothetical protein
MDHVLRNFVNRPHPGVHEHIGLAVKGFAGCQELAKLPERIGVV